MKFGNLETILNMRRSHEPPKMVNKTNKQTETIFKENFKKRKIEDTLAISKELFCINNAIATLQNGQLKLLTTSL